MSTIAPRRIRVLPILAWGYVAWSLVPVLIAVAYSFNDGRSRTMWQGFSFRWWFGDPNASVFRDESMRQAIINSLILASTTMLIVTPLGIALAIAPVGAWLAVKGGVEFLPMIDGKLKLSHSAFVPLVLALSVLLWLFGFDIIYATQDYEFDRTQGLRSLVVRWGPKNALGVAFIAHLLLWILLAVFGALAAFRLAYWLGLMVIGALLLAEHLLARRRDTRSVNVAFFKLNGTISTLFLGLVAVEVLFPWFRLQWADSLLR